MTVTSEKVRHTISCQLPPWVPVKNEIPRKQRIKIHLQPDAATFQLVQPLYVTQAFVTLKCASTG